MTTTGMANRALENDSMSAAPASSPPAAVSQAALAPVRFVARTRQATALRATPPKMMSALVCQNAAGATTRNGAARRASRSPATSRPIARAARTEAATASMMTAFSNSSPDSPICDAAQKNTTRPGGCDWRWTGNSPASWTSV